MIAAAARWWDAERETDREGDWEIFPVMRKKLSSDFKGVSGAVLHQPVRDASSMWPCKFYDKYLSSYLVISLTSSARKRLWALVCDSQWVCSNKHSSPQPQTLIKVHITPRTCALTRLVPSVDFPLVYCVSLQLASCQKPARASLHLFILPLPPLRLFSPCWPCVFFLMSVMFSPLQFSEPRSSLWGWAVKVNWAFAQLLSAWES